jgi:hypothetical protein
MGNMACLCGNIISDVCGSHGEAFSEEQVESMGFYENEFFSRGCGRSVFECEKCGCLLIEDPIDSCKIKYYVPENKKFNKLFFI